MNNKKSVNLLSIDGGGMRGLMPALVMERFCQDADINPNKLYEEFDIFSGTSIGGITALGYAYGLSPTQMKTLMRQKGPDIFNPGIFTLPFYKERVTMDLSTSNYIYDNAEITNTVKSVIPPNTKLSDLPGKVIITSWDRTKNLPILFSNITGYDFFTGHDQLVCDVATATASAPIYFQEASFSGGVYADGGVIQNNPTLIGYHAAQNIFPQINRYNVLSLGAGAAYSDVLAPSIPSTALTASERTIIQSKFANFKAELAGDHPNLELDSLTDDLFGSTLVPPRVQDLFYYMQNVFIGGVQQLVDDLMRFTTQNPFRNIHYYRFQYNFKANENSALDETDNAYLNQLEQHANTVYDSDALEIANFIQHFKV